MAKKINSKQKGNRGERELANKLREYGYDTRRGQQFKGTPDSPDVEGLPGIHIECKRVERLNIHEAVDKAIEDAGLSTLPVVMHRRNGEKWLATMQLEDWIELYEKAEGWQSGR